MSSPTCSYPEHRAAVPAALVVSCLQCVEHVYVAPGRTERGSVEASGIPSFRSDELVLPYQHVIPPLRQIKTMEYHSVASCPIDRATSDMTPSGMIAPPTSGDLLPVNRAMCDHHFDAGSLFDRCWTIA